MDNAEINKILASSWLAGEQELGKEEVIIQEASEADFNALDYTETELREQTGYAGKILVVRDKENNYVYSLIRGE